MVPKCECGQDCHELGPAEWFWSVPFTKLEIRIWDWGRPSYSEYCSDCAIDVQQCYERDSLAGAFNEIYNEGYAEGLKER